MSPPAEDVFKADVVVIGTGAGGAPVAATLAEAGLEVIALEAGPRLSTADFTGHEREMIPRLMKAQVSAVSGMEIYAGACVGGSTVINDCLCWRTPPEVLESWRIDYGLSGLRESEFGEYVDRVWYDIHAEATRRSHLNRNAHHLEVGAARLGWAAEAMPRNVRSCANLGLCNLGCPTGAKQSTLLTYLPRAERAGARLLAQTRAEQIEVRDGAVRAVEATRLVTDTPDRPLRVRIETPRVCLAAGVLGTAAVLLRSGLGHAGLSPGQRLQFHSSVSVSARFPEPVHAYYGPSMAYAVTEFSDVNGHAGPGFMLENVSTLPVATSSSLPGFGEAHERAMRSLPYLARAIVVLRDTSRGMLCIDDRGDTRIDYALDGHDLLRLRQGIVALARAYFAAGAEEVFLPLNGLAPLGSPKALRRVDDLVPELRGLSLLYAVHLFGGAVMGGRAADSCCDESGRVRGTRGLYVSDAAALPSNIGVNPQVTIMANALRVAERITLGDRGSA